MKIQFLGTSAGGPFGDRWASAAVVEVAGEPFLIDCGEGCQMRMAQFGIKKSRIRRIFITHLHGDHVFGLPGLLGSMALAGRREPLEIFSPLSSPSLGEMMQAIFAASSMHLPFDVKFTETITAEMEVIFENDAVAVSVIPMLHRVNCVGYFFQEKPKPRAMLAEKISEHEIPFSEIKKIKNGADFVRKDGILIKNEDLTLPPPEPKTLAFCSDTSVNFSLPRMLEGPDLLVHEATFLNEMADWAEKTGHSTAYQAALIAAMSGAKKLVLTHFSSRYANLEPLLEEAKNRFPNTFLAADGAVFEV